MFLVTIWTTLPFQKKKKKYELLYGKEKWKRIMHTLLLASCCFFPLLYCFFLHLIGTKIGVVYLNSISSCPQSSNLFHETSSRSVYLIKLNIIANWLVMKNYVKRNKRVNSKWGKRMPAQQIVERQILRLLTLLTAHLIITYW